MKIAVCFSGQSRTWKLAIPYIQQFFSSNIHEFYFFGHTWDTNDWFTNRVSYKIDNLDANVLHKELVDAIPFKTLQIDHQTNYLTDNSEEYGINLERPPVCGHENCAIHTKPLAWREMTKSAMLSNNLKTKYEYDNNIIFDLVVKTRYDMAYDLGQTFDGLIERSNINPRSLYCTVWPMSFERNNIAIDDRFYFGASHIMDVVDSFYRIFANGDFYKLSNSSYYDPHLKTVGAGVLLYKWLNIKNIMPMNIKLMQLPIIRNTVINKSYPSNYNEILIRARNFK